MSDEWTSYQNELINWTMTTFDTLEQLVIAYRGYPRSFALELVNQQIEIAQSMREIPEVAIKSMHAMFDVMWPEEMK